ncbi:MAG: hypothetical protein KDD77_21025, partial [Caldilineaceae bacterium]|nr:hypothetical protein [Caldilineaceae bacterium]
AEASRDADSDTPGPGGAGQPGSDGVNPPDPLLDDDEGDLYYRVASADAQADTQVAIFSDLASCQAGLADAAAAGATTTKLSEVPAQKEGAASVLLGVDGAARSSCAVGTIRDSAEGGKEMAFSFQPLNADAPAVVYVLSLADGFRDQGIDGRIKDALGTVVIDAINKNIPASILTVDGNRHVRTVLSADDFMWLQTMRSDKIERRIGQAVGSFNFVVRSMQPVPDTAAIYDALKDKKTARIYYVVDSRREEMRSDTTGPLITWLTTDNVPITVLSIGGCSKWTKTFAGIGAGLDCVDLDRFSPEASEEFLAALSLAK